MLLRTLLVFLLAASARADDAHFEKAVRPILAEHCLKCHGPDKQKGGLRLDSREAALKGGDTGPALVPGKPGESLLVKAVHFEDLEMPPSGKLPAAKVETLTRWVKDGAAWPATPKKMGAQVSGLKARTPGQITDADRKWWAFAAPNSPPPPPAGDGWAKSGLDRFVAAKQAAAGIQPAPEATRPTLIRRATFDLTGLPPTPAEVDAFLNDPSPDAYEALVDRLLASPRYGERQARFWLDLVRYAESDGYRADAGRPTAWKYRDYVVKSFNDDKPYDRFVKEQLAGDELFPDDPAARVATGYFRLGQYEYNQKDVRGQWATILNDITDVTGDAFLAMGIGCARCHDHKFDPILQKDYFALQAFFAGLRFSEEPVFDTAAAQADYEAKLKVWESKTAEVRQKMADLVAPALAKIRPKAGELYPAEIRAIVQKKPEDRTPGETQLYLLAMRQIEELEFGRADAKLPKKEKDEYAALKKRFDELSKEKPADPTALTARDLGPRAAETVIPGGKKKAAVGPAVPTVLGGGTPPFPATATSTGRRAALANWLTDPSNPLTARVFVNRVWMQHFGRGLVATPSDFGTLGEKPTHPELLDYLASEFVRGGWKLKPLHRLIVTSATYRTGSGASQDTENKLLARRVPRRLDAEQVRDAMLAVSGELDLKAGGPASAADKPRRSVFTKVLRNTPDPLLASFDAADGLASCACRNVTVTPTQSLLLLNGPGPLARAKTFAKRVMPADGKDAPQGVELAYRLAFGRPPTTEEREEAMVFLRKQVGATDKKPVTADSRLQGWADFAHALLNANEFLYLD